MKKIGKVKKFKINKLYGGKLKDDKTPNKKGTKQNKNLLFIFFNNLNNLILTFLSLPSLHVLYFFYGHSQLDVDIHVSTFYQIHN